MSYCVKCGVELDEGAERCPLCGTEVINPNEGREWLDEEVAYLSGNLDLLEERIKEMGMSPEDYWWYLDLRRYGGCKHAGFGLGFERMVMYLTGIGNIRDVLPHPRTVGSAEF